MKDDALAPSVNENHGGAFFHESDGTNNEPDKSVVSAAAYDTSASSARSRIHCAVRHALIVVASSSLLMHS